MTWCTTTAATRRGFACCDRWGGQRRCQKKGGKRSPDNRFDLILLTFCADLASLSFFLFCFIVCLFYSTFIFVYLSSSSLWRYVCYIFFSLVLGVVLVKHPSHSSLGSFASALLDFARTHTYTYTYTLTHTHTQRATFFFALPGMLKEKKTEKKRNFCFGSCRNRS